MADLRTETDEYLSQISKDLRAKVSWFGSDKKQFQIEVSENVRVPDHFEMSSSKKGYKRYTTKKTKVRFVFNIYLLYFNKNIFYIILFILLIYNLNVYCFNSILFLCF